MSLGFRMLRLLRVNNQRQFLNVLQLGLGFLLVFTAFNGAGFIEEVVLNSVASHQKANNETAIDSHAGYYSLAIIYLTFTACNLISAPIVTALSPKWAMTIGAACYALFMLSFMKIMAWLLYLSSAILGFGAAIIWTGQGTYLTQCSNADTIGRNSGILWAMLQSCLVVGGIFLYFEFRGVSDIEEPLIRTVFAVFSALVLAGTVTLALLRKPYPATDSESMAILNENVQDEFMESISAQNPEVVDSVTSISQPEEVLSTPRQNKWLKDFLDTFRLLLTKKMLLLAVVFWYSGIELTFWSGIYPTCLGFTKRFHSGANEMVALNGIFIGLGQILGGASFGLFGHRTNVYGRNPIIILGTVVHLICFYLIYLNLPQDSPIGITTNSGIYWEPMRWLALLCSFLLGFGDSCWNTQLYSLLGGVYPNDSASAFALFKFFQSLAAAGSFYYGSALLLQYQLFLLVIFCIFGALCFFPVEFEAQKIVAQNSKRN